MHRKNFILHASLALGAVSLPGKKLLSAMLARTDDPWKMRLLRNNVGIFYEKGGTIAWHLSPKGIVVVDAEFPEQAGHLIGELKKQSDKPFELLINTHHHRDHTSGNLAFKGLVSHVAAHSNSLANQQRVAIAGKAEDLQLYPDITYGNAWEYSLDDEKIQTAYFGPAHTNGDSMIHFTNANIVHMGDLIFNREWPFIDRSSGASISNWIVVLDSALKKYDHDTLFVFGHAFDPDKVTGDKQDLRIMKDMFSRLLDFVAAWTKAGKSKDDLLKEKAVPGLTEWQDNNNGIPGALQAAYEELASNTKA
jgi:glyoxylase-like metal-dependent hydrolase (beta-lactamase superfamily II)